MSEQALSLPRSAAAGVPRRVAAGSLIWAVLLGNAAVIVWLWIYGGNLTMRSSGDVLTSIARITGLLAAYLALIQVILLARLPVLERLAGFDRLSVWHRWNGHACIDLVIAESDLVFRHELAAARDIQLRHIVGDHTTEDGRGS
jgi:predicted ferric reductase